MAKRNLPEKPSKPYPTFPLTAHNNGQWCKKIRGKVYFFGVWNDPQAALDNYLRVAADLHGGRQPDAAIISRTRDTIKGICNHFLTHQLGKLNAGEITPRWFEDCRSTVENFAAYVGCGRVASDLRSEDFQRYRVKLAKRGLGKKGRGLGVHALNRSITVIRGMFKYAFAADLLDRPMKFGAGFDKPSATLKRKVRQAGELQNGKHLFEPYEIRSMLDNAETQMRAMILLGINGGFGNADCARLPIKAVDFDRAVIEFNRPKTGIERTVPLWAETVEALREALAVRPKPATEEAEKLILLTPFGLPWVRESVHRGDNDAVKKVVPIDAMGQEFNKLLTRLGLKRKGIGFYALRHTFRTWADEVRDQHAIHRIMGHLIPGMSGIYVEKIELSRLRTVVDHVRAKLFENPTNATPNEDQHAT